MQHNRKIIISAAGNRKSLNWPPQELYWSDFVEKLRTPVRSTETLTEYLRYAKGKQDELKDVGGFVGGEVKGRRKNVNIAGRDLVTLDMDNIPQMATDEIIKRIDALNCCYAVYSTRKHEPIKPRLRIIFPLDRTVTAEEYEPIIRKIAEFAGLEYCDPTTFEPARLMYWPSCSADSQYVFYYGDKPLISADGILSLYKDWRNIGEWPQVPGTQQQYKKLAVKQGDPTQKSGVVGAFCKAFNIYRALEELIPGAYIACEDGRFTYSEGSTAGGAVIYDNGNFLYSHHATDPAGGKLCNAFDLVRLHKFSELDEEVNPDTPTSRLPSFIAMSELAVNINDVAAIINKERYDKALSDFGSGIQPAEGDITNWIELLQLNPRSGKPVPTIRNVRIALEHDPNLKDKICMDSFSEYIMCTGPFPWGNRENDTALSRWTDTDDAGLRDYIEQVFGFRGKDIIQDALALTAAKKQYDPVVSLLKGLQWDGVKRLDTLFTDYLGADDSEYTRAVTRKSFVGAVARAMNPGIKFDTMIVVHGRQGLGKSTLIRKIGMDWFSDSVRTFEGKEGAELLQGVWIVEVAEMEALAKAGSTIQSIKSFLSKTDDQYRAAYARKTEKHLRKNVFFGTTNDHAYLKDPTGNRRFWPVDTELKNPIKNVFKDLTPYEVHQLWAEAFLYWQLGEPLYLSEELETEAEGRRDKHFDRDPLQGQIEDFLERNVPQDWQSWSVEKRLMFYNGQCKDSELEVTERDRICAAEIWRECLGMFNIMPKKEAHRINSVLESIRGWERASTIRFGAGYGRQKGFRRVHSYENKP